MTAPNTAPQGDTFWTWFGKSLTVLCALFTLACALGFVYVLVQDYRETVSRPYATVAPDTAHLHPKGTKP